MEPPGSQHDCRLSVKPSRVSSLQVGCERAALCACLSVVAILRKKYDAINTAKLDAVVSEQELNVAYDRIRRQDVELEALRPRLRLPSGRAGRLAQSHICGSGQLGAHWTIPVQVLHMNKASKSMLT